MTAMTTVGLDLYITGICLFVPVRKRKRIAVLMPQTHTLGCGHGGGGGSGRHGGGHGRHIAPHRSVIAVREKHLAASLCTEKVDDWCILDLAHWSLTLSNGTELESYTLGGVYDLNHGELNRRAKSVLGPELQARVDLASGTFVDAPRGKKFRIDGGKEPMSNYVQWAIEDCEPKLTLVCLRCGETQEIALDPKGESRIQLLIQHVPGDEVGPSKSSYPKPAAGTPMHHFFALDQLLEDGHDPIDVPVWEDKPGDNAGPSIMAPRGGNPYTCMPGEGGPGDDGP